jgi:hypothetical protein
MLCAAVAPRRLIHKYGMCDMLICVRTTLEINDELFRRAKKRAADEGAPFRSIVEEALRTYLGKKIPGGGYRLRWRTESGTIQPGVRLDDRDALFELMDGRV